MSDRITTLKNDATSLERELVELDQRSRFLEQELYSFYARKSLGINIDSSALAADLLTEFTASNWKKLQKLQELHSLKASYYKLKFLSYQSTEQTVIVEQIIKDRQPIFQTLGYKKTEEQSKKTEEQSKKTEVIHGPSLEKVVVAPKKILARKTLPSQEICKRCENYGHAHKDCVETVNKITQSLCSIVLKNGLLCKSTTSTDVCGFHAK